eukprot:2778567-Rhodomonas_salina.1
MSNEARAGVPRGQARDAIRNSMPLREIAMQIKASYNPSKKDIKRFMQTSIHQMQEVSNDAHRFSPL